MSDESNESSESLEVTPEPIESESQPEPQGAESIEASPEKEQEKPAPFNEHPRFKELIEQNRNFKEQVEASDRKYQQDMARLQTEMQSMRQSLAPKKEEPVDPFIRDLEKINPEYAKTLRSLQTQAAKAAQVEQQFQQYQQQQFAEKANNHFDNLLSTNKVENPIDRDLYKSAVEAEVYRREARGERLGINDLDKIFQGFHTKYSKYLEDRDRSITAKYSSAKKADVAPAPSTGGAATGPAMKKFSSMDSPETIKWLADQLRASKQQE